MRFEPSLLLLVMLGTTAHAQEAWMHWPPRVDVPAYTSAPTIEGRATGPKVDIVLERRGDSVVALVENPLAGPVLAVVTTERNGRIEATRVLVPAGERAAAVKLPASQPVNVQLRAIPGRPDARAQPADDLLPVPFKHLRIDQGANGSHSHTDDENRYALDFAAPQGTPVTAVRAGVVMDMENAQRNAGSATNIRARANFVRILHADGSMALYAHLHPGSIPVRRGQQVAAGQRIGSVGNTGYSTAPHLHYVLQVNDGGVLRSLPAHLLTPQGVLQLPRR